MLVDVVDKPEEDHAEIGEDGSGPQSRQRLSMKREKKFPLNERLRSARLEWRTTPAMSRRVFPVGISMPTNAS